jgi:hypothetical protein
MFFRQNKNNIKEFEKQREYEYAIERIYSDKIINLAIARMGYFDTYTFRKDILAMTPTYRKTARRPAKSWRSSVTGPIIG